MRTERTTWRREAPTARSSAISRLRWAISMVKVLAMMKTPTNSAIPAKTRSIRVSHLVFSAICLDCSSASLAPLVAVMPLRGQQFADLAGELLVVGAGCRGDGRARRTGP